MNASRKLALCLILSMPAIAQAKPGSAESRGELLYTTHCVACHASEVHWREQKLATDWNSLLAQVYRWQSSAGLAWSKEEIDDVARYLNTVYYGFPAPGHKGYSQDSKPDKLLRR